MILKLQEGGIVLIDNAAIREAFHQYYSTWYKGIDISLEKIDEYLKKQNALRIRGTETDYEWTYDNKGSF